MQRIKVLLSIYLAHYEIWAPCLSATVGRRSKTSEFSDHLPSNCGVCNLLAQESISADIDQRKVIRKFDCFWSPTNGCRHTGCSNFVLCQNGYFTGLRPSYFLCRGPHCVCTESHYDCTETHYVWTTIALRSHGNALRMHCDCTVSHGFIFNGDASYHLVPGAHPVH